MHNNFVSRSSNILATRNGVFDAEAAKGYRVGDNINLSGVSIKAILELNERYSDVTIRMLVIRSERISILLEHILGKRLGRKPKPKSTPPCSNMRFRDSSDTARFRFIKQLNVNVKRQYTFWDFILMPVDAIGLEHIWNA